MWWVQFPLINLQKTVLLARKVKVKKTKELVKYIVEESFEAQQDNLSEAIVAIDLKLDLLLAQVAQIQLIIEKL
jgi:hypothetical protein